MNFIMSVNFKKILMINNNKHVCLMKIGRARYEEPNRLDPSDKVIGIGVDGPPKARGLGQTRWSWPALRDVANRAQRTRRADAARGRVGEEGKTRSNHSRETRMGFGSPRKAPICELVAARIESSGQ